MKSMTKCDRMRCSLTIHAFSLCVNALFSIFLKCILKINDYMFLFLLVLLSVSGGQESPVTQTCLGCICEAISGCNRTTTCAGDVCGLFRITWAYWSDAGKPTIAGELPSSETGTYKLKNKIK